MVNYTVTPRRTIRVLNFYLAYGVCARSARGSQNFSVLPDVGVTFHVCLNDIVYLAATNAI